MKNQKCPSCGSKNSSLIFWGYPRDMEWYLDAVAKEEIVPGGCILSNNDPKWECTGCHNRWGKSKHIQILQKNLKRGTKIMED